jgi:hypothetical protein
MDPIWVRRGGQENIIKIDVKEKSCEDERDWTGSLNHNASSCAAKLFGFHSETKS